MVGGFKKILDELKLEGTVYLFAVLRMDDLTDKWSLLLSAPWIDSKNDEDKKIFFGSLIRLLDKHLSREELDKIARISLMGVTDHLAQELLNYSSGSHIGGDASVRINGNMIHEAYILESNKPVASL